MDVWMDRLAAWFANGDWSANWEALSFVFTLIGALASVGLWYTERREWQREYGRDAVQRGGPPLSAPRSPAIPPPDTVADRAMAFLLFSVLGGVLGSLGVVALRAAAADRWSRAVLVGLAIGYLLVLMLARAVFGSGRVRALAYWGLLAGLVGGVFVAF